MRDTLLEFDRKGSFVCIFPAKGCDVYDQFFNEIRPLNKFIYRSLFTRDFVQTLRVPNQDKSSDGNQKQNGNSQKENNNNFKKVNDTLKSIQDSAAKKS
jgi:hypothetical protein